jgi:uncharacterized protein YkwD
MRREGSTTWQRKALVVAIAAAMVLGLGQPAANASDRYSRKLLGIVNASRERRDLRPLRMERGLIPPARKHTKRMIRKNELFDPPRLQAILADYEWDDLGADVVGCGSTLRELHRILMTEDFHRKILLHPKLRRAGIAVVVATERNRCGRNAFWATEILYG